MRRAAHLDDCLALIDLVVAMREVEHKGFLRVVFKEYVAHRAADEGVNILGL